MADEVNVAVEEAHRRGVLTSASLMVGAAAADDALRRARALPSLRVGLHLVLVEGAPTLPAEQIPDLVDRAGRLRSDLVGLAVDIAGRPALRRQLRAEIRAQFESYARTGLVLEHVDVHKHFHLHPLVAREIIAIGSRFGMRALRVPSEPVEVLRQIDGGAATLSARLIGAWASLLRRQARGAGLLTPDAVFGLRWSGAMTEERLSGLLADLPSGLTEIYLHPAAGNHFAGHCPGYRYTDELAALCAPRVAAAVEAAGCRLGGYAGCRSATTQQRNPSEQRALPIVRRLARALHRDGLARRRRLRRDRSDQLG